MSECGQGGGGGVLYGVADVRISQSYGYHILHWSANTIRQNKRSSIVTCDAKHHQGCYIKDAVISCPPSARSTSPSANRAFKQIQQSSATLHG